MGKYSPGHGRTLVKCCVCKCTFEKGSGYHIGPEDQNAPGSYWFCSTKCIDKSEKGGCFITTATVQSRNLPDDCHELTSLRAFRDTFMKKDEIMKDEVEEYYKIAPTICANIDKEENASEIYDEIYQKWIKDAVFACDSGDKQKAHDIYKEMVLELKEKYL